MNFLHSPFSPFIKNLIQKAKVKTEELFSTLHSFYFFTKQSPYTTKSWILVFLFTGISSILLLYSKNIHSTWTDFVPKQLLELEQALNQRKAFLEQDEKSKGKITRLCQDLQIFPSLKSIVFAFEKSRKCHAEYSVKTFNSSKRLTKKQDPFLKVPITFTIQTEKDTVALSFLSDIAQKTPGTFLIKKIKIERLQKILSKSEFLQERQKANQAHRPLYLFKTTINGYMRILLSRASLFFE